MLVQLSYVLVQLSHVLDMVFKGYTEQWRYKVYWLFIVIIVFVGFIFFLQI
jgi:hypothetical protein